VLSIINSFMHEINQEKFPFITGFKYSGSTHYGIVINYDKSILTFYDLEKIPTAEMREELIILGDLWWNESNRLMPIDIFLHLEMQIFQPFQSTFVMKNIEHLFGPMTSMQDMLKKRVKRRGFQLIRKTT